MKHFLIILVAFSGQVFAYGTQGTIPSDVESDQTTGEVEYHSPPEFSKPMTSEGDVISVMENSDKDLIIYDAQARVTGEVDEGLTYSLSTAEFEGRYKYRYLFRIDPSTGEVRMTESPNYEDYFRYRFTVHATSDAGLVSDRNVTLNILNLDEGGKIARIKSRWRQGQYYPILFAGRVDDERGVDRNSLEYEWLADNVIVEGENSDSLYIDDDIAYKRIVVRVHYTTRDGLFKSIVSKGVRDNHAPVLDWLQWERHVPSRASAPFHIYDVGAFDAGRGEDVGITYSLLEEGDYEYFNIDSNTGGITLAKSEPLDQRVYKIRIWVRDEIGNWAIQSGKVIVAEEDTDKPPPKEPITQDHKI